MMASNKQEPKFWPADADEHVAETFSSLKPEEAPACFGFFFNETRRQNGCHQCAFYGACTQKKHEAFRPESSDRPEPAWLTEESDPTGRTSNEPGAKLDAGKTRVWLVLSGFARALEAVSQVGTDGAVKYSDNGWMEVPDGVARYSDAMGRHLLKEAKGEKVDPSGSLHAAHVAWNALARLELMLKEDTHDL